MPDSSTAADSPFAGSIRPKRLYIFITMQQKFIFPNNHSIHTLHPINIPSDYRFSFCLANLFKVDHNYRSVNPPFYQEGLNLLSNFQKRKGGWGWQKVYIWRKSLYTKIFLMFLKCCCLWLTLFSMNSRVYFPHIRCFPLMSDWGLYTYICRQLQLQYFVI